ncbi:MAG: hypothetical protein IPM69_07790 [Ignavibacteria bacterium]|nr:hypothetical protein [Ignavibacteria bacterium]
MEVSTLISEIQHLPLTERFFVVEETIKSIKKKNSTATWMQPLINSAMSISITMN